MLRSSLKKVFYQTLRRLLSLLPIRVRFAILRSLVDCDLAPDARLGFKVPETQDEFEQCSNLLHETYVGSRFMLLEPSGIRVCKYHALPTTTTLCALFDGVLVGTISMLREGVFRFLMQTASDRGFAQEGRQYCWNIGIGNSL